MPAQISMNKDGSAAAIYRVPAWHRLGIVEGNTFSARDAMRKVGLDFGVEEVVAGGIVDGVFVPFLKDGLPAMKLNYKYNDDGTVTAVGIVGTDRTNISPPELFEFADELVGEIDGAHYEAMFALREFRQVVGVINAGDVVLDAEGRGLAVGKYLVARTSYDGSMTFGVKWSMVVPECANMMQVHLATAMSEFTTRHTLNIKDRMGEAKRALGLFDTYAESWGQAAEELVQAEITDKQFDKWLDGLYYNYGKFVNDGVMERDDVDTNAMTITRTLYESSPTCQGIKGTAWGALNAATEFGDWFSVLNKAKKDEGKEQVFAERQFVRQLEGKAKYAAGFKQFAWEWTKEFVDA